MILTSLKKIQNKYLLSFCFVSLLFLYPNSLLAQGLSLSVTPALFEMSAAPLQAWKSSIKVLNTNQQELTVYATVVNFKPKGETGQGTFLPMFQEYAEGKTLAEWITVSKEPFVIPKESSVQIPIQVNVPKDATPGGHYAAIMIGTRPMNTDAPFQVRTSQVVTSLFFVRIAGDVIEKGGVRTFRTTTSFFQKPVVDFEVRFENKGNVHLQPQGEILITNMWGKERGVVPINQKTNFGNVLPNSIRQFNFTWRGEQSITDIGRYKAQLTLGFGQEGRQFVTQAIYFWIIPIKPVVMTFAALLVFMWLVTWSIKSYVRRMLTLSTPQGYVPASQRNIQKGDVIVEANTSLRKPVQVGFIDFKIALAKTNAFWGTCVQLGIFVKKYYKFFITLMLFILMAGVLFFYLKDVMIERRDYEIVIDKKDTNITISSEQVLYEKTVNEDNNSSQGQTGDIAPLKEQIFELVLINSSNTPGSAARLQGVLESEGYLVSRLKSDFTQTKERTVIVYDTKVQNEALALSKLLDGVLLSAKPETKNDTIPKISIFVGNEYSSL